MKSVSWDNILLALKSVEKHLVWGQEDPAYRSGVKDACDELKLKLKERLK